MMGPFRSTVFLRKKIQIFRLWFKTFCRIIKGKLLEKFIKYRLKLYYSFTSFIATGMIKSISLDSRSTKVKTLFAQHSARSDTNHRVGFRKQSLSVLNSYLQNLINNLSMIYSYLRASTKLSVQNIALSIEKMCINSCLKLIK